MLTENFINSCFFLILSKTDHIKKTKSLYKDIEEIINYNRKKEFNDIPLSLKNKVDCLLKINEMLLEDKTIDNIIDSISFSEKFKPYHDFLSECLSKELKSIHVDDIIKQIVIRKKIKALFGNYTELEKVLQVIKEGSFDSIDDVVLDYEVTVKKLYSNLMETNRSVEIRASATLDLIEDDYDFVVEKIKDKYDKKNKTPSGFSILDATVLNGGFDPSRLYIIAGGTGAGKSTLLNNLILNSAMFPGNLHKPTIRDDIKKVYIYITLENTIEESLLRTYQAAFGKTIQEVLLEINNNVDIKAKLIEKLNNSKSTIIFKYFPSKSISAFDLMNVLDEAIDKFGKESIMGLYVDFLDFLKTETKYDLLRIELGQVTIDLKNLAVEYNIPVITATHLGRSVYRVGSANELSIDQIGESIKKVEYSDCVILLALDPKDDTVVFAKVGKNRAGQSNVAINFKVNFKHFKFINGTYSSKTSNIKSDSSPMETNLDDLKSFQGFDDNFNF